MRSISRLKRAASCIIRCARSSDGADATVHDLELWRSIVGCLALVGRGQWQPRDIQRALEARDRAELGLNAPAEGLYFVEAVYP